MSNKLNPLKAGEAEYCGYIDKLVRFTVSYQLTDDETWALFVNQFRIHSDNDNCWRGEYWGKMMRGGCMTYACTKDEKLYASLEKTVKDLLAAQDADGRITTYPSEREFNGWDMWVRKYVMLGLIYFYDICESRALKAEIIIALEKHADYIISRIGENKKPLLDTSAVWGGLNSASILEPFVKLYNMTKEPRYLDFSSYIVSTGFCKDMNLINICYDKSAFPYQFKHTKAYEMMSCFEGLLEYYRVTGNENHLAAVKNFVDMVHETDITIIGCAGCTHELFDNSAVKQTEYNETVMQETCVTVTWMKLCYNLLLLTGDGKYAGYIETSALNAMAGAVNDEKQDMHRAAAMVYSSGEPESVPHEPYPFDSYSPLADNRRGRKVGGFKKMQNGRSYGCCACIGSAGTALTEIFGILKGSSGFYVNLYNRCDMKTEINGGKINIEIFADLYKSGEVKINVSAEKSFNLALRIPDWSDKFIIKSGEEVLSYKTENGYAVIEIAPQEKILTVELDNSVKKHSLNGKTAYTKGPFVLATDKRFEANTAFNANLVIPAENGRPALCDYASAGKNYDDEISGLSVWL